MARGWLDYGVVNAGGAPAFQLFKNSDSLANVTAPSIVEAGQGWYYFDVDFAALNIPGVIYRSTFNGVELGGLLLNDALTSGTAVASAASANLAGYKTAQYIVNTAAIQLGLLNGPIASLGDPFASTDPAIQQLISFVNYQGEDLNNRYNWPQFIRECTITTAGSATTYALPADFHEMYDQSGWNRSMRIPLIGPVTAQERQFLKARMGTILINIAFDLRSNLITFPIAPSDGQTVIFEYLSDYWVQTAGSGSGPDASSITAATDTVLYDPDLMVAGIKLLWSEAKGFDTAILSNRFEGKVSHALERAYGARTLNLAGSGLGTDRLLDTNNLPITGYGGVA